MRLRSLQHRSRVSLAIVMIPERMPNAVAAFDLDHRALRAVAPALASALVANTASTYRRGLAVFAVSPQVGAEVGHQRTIGRSSSRIKSGSKSVSSLNGSMHRRFAGSGSARTQTGCPSDLTAIGKNTPRGNRRSGSDKLEAIRPGADHHRDDSKPECQWSALGPRNRTCLFHHRVGFDSKP